MFGCCLLHSFGCLVSRSFLDSAVDVQPSECCGLLVLCHEQNVPEGARMGPRGLVMVDTSSSTAVGGEVARGGMHEARHSCTFACRDVVCRSVVSSRGWGGGEPPGPMHENRG